MYALDGTNRESLLKVQSNGNLTQTMPCLSNAKKVVFKLNSTLTMEPKGKKNPLMANGNAKVMKSLLKARGMNLRTECESTAERPQSKRSSDLAQNIRLGSYHFLNDGIVAQCRKWERLQERAEALERHNQLLAELRWKMVLSGGSKKSIITAKSANASMKRMK